MSSVNENPLSQTGTLSNIHPTIAAYGQVLMDAGFTVYAPAGAKRRRLDFMHYSRNLDGRECFGTIVVNYFGEFDHHMPVKPSREHGSAIILPGKFDPFSIETALHHARPSNMGAFIGGVVKENAVPWGIGDRYLPVSQPGTGKESS